MKLAQRYPSTRDISNTFAPLCLTKEDKASGTNRARSRKGHTACACCSPAYVTDIPASIRGSKFILKTLGRKAWMFSQTDGCALLSNAYFIFSFFF